MAVIDQTAGFKFAYRLYDRSAVPTRQRLLCSASATLTKWDLISASSGKAALAATNDLTLLGAMFSNTVVGVANTTYVEVIVDDDAVYEVYDANARSIGDKLDISGTTGAMTVATDSHHDLVVVANSTADQLTLVRINTSHHVTHQ